MLERQRVGDGVEAARRHRDVGGHRAVDAVAEALARRAQVVAPGAAHHAGAADDGGRLADDAVAFLERRARPCRPWRPCRRTRGRAHRHVHGPGMRGVELVDVGAADRDRADLRAGRRASPISGHWHFAQLDRQRLEAWTGTTAGWVCGHLGSASGKLARGARGHAASGGFRRQISCRMLKRSVPAGLKSSASMTSGAPSTTSGAPCAGHSIACWMVRPPTAWTGTCHGVHDRGELVHRAQSLDQPRARRSRCGGSHVHAERLHPASRSRPSSAPRLSPMTLMPKSRPASTTRRMVASWARPMTTTSSRPPWPSSRPRGSRRPWSSASATIGWLGKPRAQRLDRRARLRPGAAACRPRASRRRPRRPSARWPGPRRGW